MGKEVKFVVIYGLFGLVISFLVYNLAWIITYLFSNNIRFLASIFAIVAAVGSFMTVAYLGYLRDKKSEKINNTAINSENTNDSPNDRSAKGIFVTIVLATLFLIIFAFCIAFLSLIRGSMMDGSFTIQ